MGVAKRKNSAACAVNFDMGRVGTSAAASTGERGESGVRAVLRLLGLAVLLWAAAASGARGARIEVMVRSVQGVALADAVVYALPLGRDGKPLAVAQAGDSAIPGAVIAQRNKEFVPYVTAVQVGARVVFPNEDDVLHNVYSFSPTKRFQLPLYKGSSPSVLFDKPGTVVLGCNIHDWMVAYLYVLDTRYFTLTDGAGRAVIDGLPAGSYRVGVKHPRKRRRGSSKARVVRVSASGAPIKLTFELSLKAQWRHRRPE